MRLVTLGLAAIAAATMQIPAGAAGEAPLALTSARVSIEGTSNIHAYTASSTAVRVTTVEIAGAGAALERALEPGALRAFDVVIPAASLTSPKDGIDKNMHKALKAEQHPEIRFRLHSLTRAGQHYQVAGLVTIAGVERAVTLDVQIERQAAGLAVTGRTALVMTDFGVTPPKAMMGMLRTSPNVTVTFDLMLAAN